MDGSSLADWERAGLHKAEARWDGWLWAGCNWSGARWDAACSNVPGQ